MGILPQILSRVSIKNFKNISLDEEKLRRILEAGRRAPSAKNRQPWRFVVITKDDLKEEVAKFVYNRENIAKAGAIIAACSTNIEYILHNGLPSYPMDISFAVSFMMLQAEKEGYGSCIVTLYDEASIARIISVPYSMKIVMLLLVGVPEERPPQSKRKSFDQIVSFNHW